MTGENSQPVLVLGASGTQGAAVARTLIAQGIPVRAVARSDQTVEKLKANGIAPVTGNFEDRASLIAACTGVRAIFSMQPAAFQDPQSERREARNILDAALDAGVPQVVHTSVSGAGAYHRAMKDWGTGRWNENYWESKADVEDMVRTAGLPFWTLLKPAFMMENFVEPKVPHFFPHLAKGELVSALKPDTAMVLVTADDIGAAAAAAIADPERFNRAEIELAGDKLTMTQVAAILSEVCGRTIVAHSVEPDEAIARGMFSGWVASQQWANEVPYPATPEDSLRHGLHPTSMAEWARKNVELFT